MADVHKRFEFRHAPIIFAEIVAHMSFSGQSARLYLTRWDSPLEGGSEREPVPVAQLVMPLEGLLNTAIFLETFVEDALKKGVISQEYLDGLRKEYAEANP